MSNESFREAVVRQAKAGNLVFMGIDGPKVMKLDKFIEQPAEGILYDLNRSPEVVLTFIDDPKWVNDYAVALVITALKKKLDQRLKKKLDQRRTICPFLEGANRNG